MLESGMDIRPGPAVTVHFNILQGDTIRSASLCDANAGRCSGQMLETTQML